MKLWPWKQLAELKRLRKQVERGTINVVFTGPPSHQSGQFVEVEDLSGKSIKLGEWESRPDGFWNLKFYGAAELGLQVVSRFIGDEVLTFRQGAPDHELEYPVTAEDCAGWVKKIRELEHALKELQELVARPL